MVSGVHMLCSCSSVLSLRLHGLRCTHALLVLVSSLSPSSWSPVYTCSARARQFSLSVFMVSGVNLLCSCSSVLSLRLHGLRCKHALLVLVSSLSPSSWSPVYTCSARARQFSLSVSMVSGVHMLCSCSSVLSLRLHGLRCTHALLVLVSSLSPSSWSPV